MHSKEREREKKNHPTVMGKKERATEQGGGREKMNYATNRKMLLTGDGTRGYCPLSLSLDLDLFVFCLSDFQDKRGGEREENEKKWRAMICNGPVTRCSFLPMDRPSPCFACLSPATSPIGYTPATKPLFSSSSALIRTEWR